MESKHTFHFYDKLFLSAEWQKTFKRVGLHYRVCGLLCWLPREWINLSTARNLIFNLKVLSTDL